MTNIIIKVYNIAKEIVRKILLKLDDLINIINIDNKNQTTIFPNADVLSAVCPKLELDRPFSFKILANKGYAVIVIDIPINKEYSKNPTLTGANSL